MILKRTIFMVVCKNIHSRQYSIFEVYVKYIHSLLNKKTKKRNEIYLLLLIMYYYLFPNIIY